MEPIDEVEAKQAMRGLAAVAWSFYSDLCREGFGPPSAMQLVNTWMRAVATPQPTVQPPDPPPDE